jgi:uncharacterized membrane-anchored protein
MAEKNQLADAAIKVPAITLGFWIIKILATTLGETAGDVVSMSWLGETTSEATGWGYLIGTAIFGTVLLVLVLLQIKARGFRPWLYWATIIASTTAGTTLADYATRSLGIGYTGGSTLLLALVLVSLFAWYCTTGSISVSSVATPTAESYYAPMALYGRSYLGSCEYHLRNRHQLFDRISDLLCGIEQMPVIEVRIGERSLSSSVTGSRPAFAI